MIHANQPHNTVVIRLGDLQKGMLLGASEVARPESAKKQAAEVEFKSSNRYAPRMSLSEILDEIPKLSFAERQELVRRAIALDEENALLDARVEDFRQNPDVGVPLEGLKEWVRGRLPRR